MKARVLVVAACAALAAAYLFREVGGSGASDRPPAPPRTTAVVPSAALPLAPPSAPLRNVFEYSDPPSGAPSVPDGPALAAPSVATAPQDPSPEPSPLVRLVGLVRRAGQVKAALAVAGDTVVLAAGESAAGFTVISIDEDEGVRLRGPDGAVVVLMRAEE
jgi:hypothetical protein